MGASPAFATHALRTVIAADHARRIRITLFQDDGASVFIGIDLHLVHRAVPRQAAETIDVRWPYPLSAIRFRNGAGSRRFATRKSRYFAAASLRCLSYA